MSSVENKLSKVWRSSVLSRERDVPLVWASGAQIQTTDVDSSAEFTKMEHRHLQTSQDSAKRRGQRAFRPISPGQRIIGPARDSFKQTSVCSVFGTVFPADVKWTGAVLQGANHMCKRSKAEIQLTGQPSVYRPSVFRRRKRGSVPD